MCELMLGCGGDRHSVLALASSLVAAIKLHRSLAVVWQRGAAMSSGKERGAMLDAMFVR